MAKIAKKRFKICEKMLYLIKNSLILFVITVILLIKTNLIASELSITPPPLLTCSSYYFCCFSLGFGKDLMNTEKA